MKLFVFLGPPGVGKGTQCSLLAARQGYHHVSTGTLVRQEIAAATPLGLRVKDLVEAGNFVDDESIVQCLETHLKRKAYGVDAVILLDGLPRNLHQVSLLEERLPLWGGTFCGAMALVADAEALVERFSKRAICSFCSYVGSWDTTVDLAQVTCPSCGKTGGLGRRADDAPAVVRHRANIYKRETEPLLSYYGQKGCLFQVNGLQAQEVVYEQVSSLLGAVLKDC